MSKLNLNDIYEVYYLIQERYLSNKSKLKSFTFNISNNEFHKETSEYDFRIFINWDLIFVLSVVTYKNSPEIKWINYIDKNYDGEDFNFLYVEEMLKANKVIPKYLKYILENVYNEEVKL